MPFKSQAQRRWMHAAEDRGEVPKGTASRWEKHTPNKSKLPEKKKKSTKKAEDVELEKRAFVAAFVEGCARAGVTDPKDVAALAVKFAARIKQADAASAAGGVAGGALGGLTTAAAIGSGVLPLAGGFVLGNLGGRVRNQTDEDDAEVLRMAAEANAYRRRAAEAKTHAQVRKLLASDPSKYVVIG